MYRIGRFADAIGFDVLLNDNFIYPEIGLDLPESLASGISNITDVLFQAEATTNGEFHASPLADLLAAFIGQMTALDAGIASLHAAQIELVGIWA